MTAPEMMLPLTLTHPEVMRDPYPVYAYYREHDPVHLVPGSSNRYVLTRHAHVLEALRHKSLVRAVRKDFRHGTEGEIPPEFLTYAQTVREWVLFKNLPEHRPLRQSINRVLGAAELGGFRASVAECVRQVMEEEDDHVTGAPIDLVSGLSTQITTRIITDLMGITELVDPDRLNETLTALQVVISIPFDPEVTARASSGLEEVYAEVRRVMDAAARVPERAIFLRALAQEAALGDLKPEQVLPMASFLLIAARDNVRASINSVMMCLLSRPGLWQELRADESLLPGAVEEMERFEAPVQTLFRHAAHDLEIGGVPILKDQVVTVTLAAANRDPRVYTDPDVYDIQRDCSKMASFGSGLHRCPGEKLALVIVEESLRAFLRAWPNPWLAIKPDQLRWQGTAVFRALAELPVVVR